MMLTKTFDEVFSSYNTIVETTMGNGTKILSPSVVTNGTVLISKLMPTDTIYIFNNSTFKTVLDLTMAAAKTEEEQADDQVEASASTSNTSKDDSDGLYPIAQEAGENVDTIKVSAMMLRLNRDIKMKNNNVLFEVTDKAVKGKLNAYRLVALNASMIAEKSEKNDKLLQKMLTLLNKNAELVFKK